MRLKNKAKHTDGEKSNALPSREGFTPSDRVKTPDGYTKRVKTDFRAKSDSKFPRQCASMKDFESVFGIDIAVLKYLRERGLCSEGFEASNRVNALPVFKAISAIMAGLLPQLDQIKGIAMLNPAQEKAKLDREKRLEAELANAERRGDIYTRDEIEELLGPRLDAIAEGWRRFEKETGGKMRALLSSSGVPQDIITQTIAMAVSGVEEPLQKIREVKK